MQQRTKPHREIIQIAPYESFMIFDRFKERFDYPIHYHPEFELNFIANGKGLRRVVGNSMEVIDNHELALIGPNLPHCWEQHKSENTTKHEITLQFHNNLLDANLLNKTLLKPIKDMLEKANNGVLFSKETFLMMKPRLCALPKLDGIDYFLEILSILYDLAISRNQRVLTVYNQNLTSVGNKRLDKLYIFVQKNYSRKITLAEVGELLNMSKVSLNRFIKKSTGKTFVEYLNDVRIGYASRQLIEKQDSISQIAFSCGFNTIANFNRIFKKGKGCTPSQYRQNFYGIKRAL